MKSLTVQLINSASDHLSRSPLALPLRILDADGGVIAESAASASQAANFNIQDIDPVFVRLTWPSGKIHTKRVDFGNSGNATVSFIEDVSSHDAWGAWAIPRLNPKSSLAVSDVASRVDISRYDHVWLRLWKFNDNVWTEIPIRPSPEQRYSSKSARQIDFNLTANPWLLQVGGTDVPWRFVSLPGNGACRVLLTPNESTDPRSLPLKVVVTGFRPDAETLLEFLVRDSIRAASALARLGSVAEELMEKKFKDPIAAVVGAYYSLRTNGWGRLPVWWFENLASSFQWIPDGAVIRSIVMIRSGLQNDSDESNARALLETCVRRGPPIFAEGLALMQEAASALCSSTTSKKEGIFRSVENLAASQAWAGATLSFYGREPDTPTPKKVFGDPSEGRENLFLLSNLG